MKVISFFSDHLILKNPFVKNVKMLVFSRLQDIFKLFILILLFICAFTGMGISQSCNCKEYIYINEPFTGTVHKLEVNPGIPLTEVIGVNGGANWYPGSGTSQLSSPHGLAYDLNGNLYIGGSAYSEGSPLRKFDCDGEIDPAQKKGV